MKYIISLICFLYATALVAQDVIMQTATVSQCGGVFYDSGGEFGPYENNENFILTICPENAGQLVRLDFTAFQTQLNTDVMIIYNGDSVAAPQFGTFSGVALPPDVVATDDNGSGCVTIEFISNANGPAAGWAANISCLTPCQTIVSQIDSASPAPNSNDIIRVCPNEEITLTGSGTFSLDSTGATYEWDLGDGNTVSGQSATFSYTTPGVYIVNLNINDSNTSVIPEGCSNDNLINQVIQVATDPDFTGTLAVNDTICFGESTTIEGIVNPVPFINDCTPPFGENIELPDGNGAVYETQTTVDCYDSNATLTDASQLISICINMEHSYSGDLDITIISPNGQQADLFTQAGGGIYFGGADNNDNGVPGIGADYCFSMSATIPLANAPTVIAGSNPPNASWRPGTYLPVESFNNLVGSPLNGNWTIRVVDNIGIDDGTIFSWEIDFDPNLQPPELSFTPAITSQTWDADPTIINTTGSVITVEPTAAGQTCYTYRVTDDFGCEYTEVVCVDVLPEIVTENPNELFVCDTGAPPYIFDLETNTAVVLSNATNASDLVVTYHNTQTDADADVGEITGLNTYSGTDGEPIFIRVEYLNSGCYEVLPFTLNIAGNPDINPMPDIEVCDDASNDGVEVFDLSTQTIGILGVQDPSAFNVSYHLSFADADTGTAALPLSYTNVNNPEPIWVRVESAGDSSCYNASPNPIFNLVVNARAQAIQPPNLEACDDISGDGVETFDLSAQNAIILGGQDPLVYTVSYHTSQTDADSNLGALPLSYANNTPNLETIFVRVEDPAQPECYATTSFNLVVDPLPAIVAPMALEVCDDGVPDGLTAIDLSLKNTEITGNNPDYAVSYYETLADAQSGTNVLPTLYTNTSNPQTIYVRVEDIGTGCYDTTLLDLVVQQAPVANIPAPFTYCDPDNDGFGEFILTDLDNEITGGVAGVSVTYHDTFANADTNAAAIDTSIPYSNIVINTQIVYARVESTTIATNCASIVPVELIVYPSPEVPTILSDYLLCDDNNDGILQFDLNTKTAEILGAQDPTALVLSYHVSASDAQTGNNPIINTGNYTNTSNPQVIYVRLFNPLTGCQDTGLFNIEAILPPVAVQATPLEQCDDLGEVGDELTVFDLTVKDTEITGGNGSWSVAYYETDADAQAQANAIADPTQYTNTSVNGLPANPQTLYAVVTDTDTGCIDFTTLTIRVLPNPSPTPSALLPDLELCDANNIGDGQEDFDLTQNELLMLNGETGVTASYYETESDAHAGINPIPDPTVYTNIQSPEQEIYVRVTNDLTGCYTLVDFTIRVNPLPEVVAVTDFIQCELNTDGFDSFDLTTKTAEVLAGQDPSLFTVSYHESLTDAQALLNGLVSPYTNQSNPQQIFVAITNTVTGCSIATQTFTIEVQEAAQANPDTVPIVYEVCDDNMETDGDPSNDSVQFDLATQDADILDGQDPSNYIVSYYATEEDANLNVNPLPLLYENLSNPQVIYARVDNNTPDGTTGLDSSICYAVTPLTLQVNPLPEFSLEQSYTLCINSNGTEVINPPIIATGLSEQDYSFEWRFNGEVLALETSSSLVPNQAGSYQVIVTHANTGCVNDTEVGITEVIESDPPSLELNLVTQAFAENHVIEAIAIGNGDYEYSLDGGPWQDSNIFTDVSPGIRVITARDKNGCGLAEAELLVIDYPLYFTPNGDGTNDTWNIVGIDTQPNAKIYIFDRYGKLLKQLSPLGNGWNGTFNGNAMPSSDYWFTVDYNEPSTGDRKTFNAHFTLKR